MSAVRQYMRRRGRRRIAPTDTEIIRFALEYAAGAIKAERKGEATVAAPEVSGELQGHTSAGG
jgi:hypothetical protein